MSRPSPIAIPSYSNHWYEPLTPREKEEPRLISPGREKCYQAFCEALRKEKTLPDRDQRSITSSNGSGMTRQSNSSMQSLGYSSAFDGLYSPVTRHERVFGEWSLDLEDVRDKDIR